MPRIVFAPSGDVVIRDDKADVLLTLPEADACRALLCQAASVQALKKAMHCLTAETEEQWRRSQAYEEAPYHFLFVAITAAESA